MSGQASSLRSNLAPESRPKNKGLSLGRPYFPNPYAFNTTRDTIQGTGFALPPEILTCFEFVDSFVKHFHPYEENVY
jgi:hypothetical protein